MGGDSVRTFLVCADELHAEVVDALVFSRLRDVDGTCGSEWSGVWTDGTRYGIVWAAPVSELFGQPEDFPDLVLVEDVDDEWTLVVPEAQEGP